MKKYLLSLCLSLFVSSILLAQAPNSFKYQAVVRDASSNILSNQNVSFKLSVYKTSATGTLVYSETHNLTTNNYGLANMNIGGGTVVSGNFSTIDWGSDTYFIKTEIDPAGGSSYSTMGTSQLQSVPYALNAKSVTGMNMDDLADVSSAGATTNQILSWNGTSWVPITSTGGTVYSAGSGITLSGTTFSNAAPDQTVSINGSGSTSVSGAYPNFTISSTDNNTTYTAGTGLSLSGTTFGAQTTSALWNANQLQGRNVSSTAPTSNQVLGWDGSQWTPQTVATGGTSLWTTNGTDIYRTSGNVAIGAGSAPAKLFVTGSIPTTHSSLIYSAASGGSQWINATNAMFFLSGSASGDNFGVYSSSDGTSGDNVGVKGITNNGVAGRINVGVEGEVQSNSNAHYNYGATGVAYGSGDGAANTRNTGVYGEAEGNLSTNIGALFNSDGTTGTLNIGVYGNATGVATNYAGYFNGNLAYTGTLTNPSDKRLKKEIVLMENSLQKINKLKVYTYFYDAKDEFQNLNLSLEKQFGFLAQDLEELFPNLVHDNKVPAKMERQEDGTINAKGGGADYKSINHIGMIPVLTKAIQEQQELIDKQNELIKALDQRIVELEKQ